MNNQNDIHCRTDTGERIIVEMQNHHQERLVYLTLPLFRKGADECETNLERWIYTLKNMTTLEDIPFLSDNPVFRYLADVADISALSQKDRQRYDESIKTMRDHISAYETAINKGRREGLTEGLLKGLSEGEAKGRLEGKAEGLKEGLLKGKMEGTIQTARRMKVEGFSIELIAKITGLSPEEIAGL